MAELRKYPPSVGRCVCAHPAGSQRPAWKAARYAGYASSFAARVPATQVSDRGRIQLKLTRAGSSALLSMRDNGIGLAPEHPDSIFSLFTPVDSSPARQGGGLGIGLTLVRCVLELQAAGEPKGYLFGSRGHRSAGSRRRWVADTKAHDACLKILSLIVGMVGAGQLA
jgi:hypothetical protein